MFIVDAHAHSSPRWYEPVETLLFQMGQNAVVQALLVQSVYDYDNQYLFDSAQAYPGRFGVVVVVDTTRPSAVDELRQLARQGAAGLRLRPWDRSPGTDPVAIWREALKLRLPVTCMGTEKEFSAGDFFSLVEELPGLVLVLEHLGCGIGRVPDRGEFQKVLQLSRYPNIYLKMCGFGELTAMPKPIRSGTFPVVPPEIGMALEAFGAKRIMWSSNFPNCSAREGYRNSLVFPLERLEMTQPDKEWVFAKTAQSVWKLPGQQ
ncbi:MAG: amidohydrolase [Chloroflexi bacterium]|nr:amidohydrolase [Chloroflexota bacterium]